MYYKPKYSAALFAGAATIALLAAGAAQAQSTESVPTSTAQPSELTEVVVTATRQSSSVNKVALSISAVTQQTLDQQGVKTTSDLARVVPGIGFRSSAGDRLPQIAIRGIASSAGAQTTGVYFDDIPLQQPGIVGGPVSGAGTPLPQIFDLARIEVLKGPQGTLYGGSAEGGAIRFINTTPSLTKFSGYAKAEGISTDSGSPSYNAGVAVGGPIVEDKLGFRASIYDRHTGGYIDDVSRFNGSTVGKDLDWGQSQAYRLALLWKPTENLEITPSFYLADDKANDVSLFWENIPQYTIASKSFQANGTAATSPANTVFTVPAHTYGPYNMYGPYKSGTVTNVGDNFQGTIPITPETSPAVTQLAVADINFKYDTPWFTTNFITGLVTNGNKGILNSTYGDPRIITGSPFVYNLPQFYNYIYYNNHRTQNTEELRFTSNSDGRLTWTGGVYRQSARQVSYATTTWNYDALMPVTRGITDVQFYGVPLINTATHLASFRDQEVIEDERAIYGEATYKVTDKLKITAGARYSRSEISYNLVLFGQTLGSLTPTVANGGLTIGSKTETPVTPKFGISYQLDPATLLYANAAKGYRVGGINSPASVAKCASDLAALGIPSLPTTFNSDSVWNYEVGSKTRILGAQWNSSLFYVDWNAPQTKVSLPTCGTSYVINAGHAISRGVESSLEVRPFDHFTFTGQVAYTDARYTQQVGLHTPTANPVFVLAGDKLPVPPLSYALAGQYDFSALGDHRGYFRADYQFSSNFQQGPGPGTTSYTPDTFMLGATHLASVRLGLNYWGNDISIFSNNVLGSKDIISLSGGRSSCPDAACTAPRSITPNFTGFTVRPREVGVTLARSF